MSSPRRGRARQRFLGTRRQGTARGVMSGGAALTTISVERCNVMLRGVREFLARHRAVALRTACVLTVRYISASMNECTVQVAAVVVSTWSIVGLPVMCAFHTFRACTPSYLSTSTGTLLATAWQSQITSLALPSSSIQPAFEQRHFKSIQIFTPYRATYSSKPPTPLYQRHYDSHLPYRRYIHIPS